MKNNFKALAAGLKPREQMMAAARASDVSSEALLAILLKTGVSGCDVLNLSRRLINVFGTVRDLMRCEWREIQTQIVKYNKEHPQKKISGIGTVKLLELGAAFELARRAYMNIDVDFFGRRLVDSSECWEVFKLALQNNDDKENMWLLPLDVRLHPICRPVIIARGQINVLHVCVRDILADAIRRGAANIVIAHNHPSGDLEPSVDDIHFTRQLSDAAHVLGIRLLDHIIISSDNLCAYVSIRDVAPELLSV